MENKIKKAYKLSKRFYKKYSIDTSAMIYYTYDIEKLFYNKRQEKVLKLYNELIITDTNNIHFYNLKSAYLLRQSYYDDGITLAKKTIVKKPNIETYRFLALLYEGKKDTINTDYYFNEALKIDSNNAFLNYTIGQTMFYRKNYYNSAKYFLNYLVLAKKNSINVSPAIIPDLIISLWYIDDKEKALYYWKIHSKNNEAYYNYRFNNNQNLLEIKKYCESHK